MTPELLVANLIVCLAGFVQTTTGVGFAMIAVPMLLLVDLKYAPGPALFAMLFLAIAMSIGAWNDVDREAFPFLFPGLAVGTIVGSVLVGMLSEQNFGLVFGLIVLGGIALGLMGCAPEQTPRVDAASGVVSGAMGTMSGIHGPPLAVLYQRAEPTTARATIAFVFVVASSLSLISLSAAGLFGRQEVVAGLSLLPGLAVGFLLARSGRQFISDGAARYGMLGIAAVSAIVLIFRSIG